MKLLIITNLFPNQREPGRGLFNKQQIVALSKLCEVRVVAPIPCGGANAPSKEIIEGVKTYHPRHIVIPKIGRQWSGQLMYLGIKNTIKEIHQKFDFDVILATWAYPDCYAASLVAKDLQKPLVCKVHGSDINVGITTPWRSTLIASSFGQAQRIIAVSKDLKGKIVRLGIEEKKIVVIGNGVDSSIFKKLDKKVSKERRHLDPQKKYILFIGNLVPVKGITHLIDAMKRLPEHVHLNILGDGELKDDLALQSHNLGLEHRIHFYGRVQHQDIPVWLNSSDVFCLPSLNEGCPNVVLEALACSVPVVGSRVGGIPELIDSKEKGVLAQPADAASLANALMTVLDQNISPTFENQTQLSWQSNAEKVLSVLQSVKDA